MFKEMFVGFFVIMISFSFLSASKNTVIFDKEERRDIPFCLAQISRATLKEVINQHEEQINLLVKSGERPLYPSLRFTYWQVTDESITLLLEQDPLGNEKRAAFLRILSFFKAIGCEYKAEHDDCVVS